MSGVVNIFSNNLFWICKNNYAYNKIELYIIDIYIIKVCVEVALDVRYINGSMFYAWIFDCLFSSRVDLSHKASLVFI